MPWLIFRSGRHVWPTRAKPAIGDDARDPDAPWRRELTASFDGA
ncbi:hypothetical protein [Thiocystis violacea]|nr:hypothetical protein [Thiocystis violacea]